MTTARKGKLPSGIQDFEGLRNDGYRYVDISFSPDHEGLESRCFYRL